MAITLFPLLVSNTVSKNIVPGVAKVLENYIMVYGMSSVLRQIHKDKNIKGNYSIQNNKVVRREDDSSNISNVSDFLYNEIIEEQSRFTNYGGRTKGKGQPSRPSQKPEIKKDDEVKPKEKTQTDKAQDAPVKLDVFNMNALTLEPTWMKMDFITKENVKTSQIIGVKVIPYLVKSDVSLARLLMYDKQVGKLQRMAIITGRKATTWLYKQWYRIWSKLPGTSTNDVVSGDPRKDIILKRSIMSSNDIQSIFALANQADLSDDFMASAKGVMNLQSMGWGSVIIADDVNRRVAFCMKELKGLCSMMPYTMLYQTLSQAKVYEDIEDAKRTASSIFKVRRERMTKLIGEAISQNKTENFGSENLPLLESDLLSEIEYIDENLGSFMKELTPAKLKSMIPNLVRGKTKDMPSTSLDKVVKVGTRINPDFRKGYVLAKKVISNTIPGASEKYVDGAAVMIAARAALKAKDSGEFMNETKFGIKSFIKLFRKSSSKADKAKLPPEHYVDATIGWVVITLGLLFVASSYAAVLWAGRKLEALVSGLFKNVDAGAAGVTPDVVKQAAEDWTTAAAETGKEFLIQNAPWIAFAFIVAVLIRKMLK